MGFSQVSNIRLATNQERMDEYKYYAGVAKTIGVDVRFLTPDQVKEVWPLCNTEDLVGAIQHVEDGYIQPADLTQALAKGARNGGAEIYRNTAVIGIERAPNGEWTVKTDKGDITCEHVVSATGNFVRQTGAMVGLDIPVIPVEHQYIVTEPHPEIVERTKQGLPEMGVLRESDASYYLREENAAGCCSAPTRSGRLAAMSTVPDDDLRPNMSCSQERSRPVWSPISRPPSTGCRLRRGRRQAGLQRRDLLYAGRLADRRSGLGPEELLAQ